MNWLDLLIIFWLAAALISGLRMGLVYKVATTIGFVVGLWIASRYTPYFAEQWNLGPVKTAVVFLIISSVISRLFGLAGWLVNKIFHLVAIFPFVKTFNRVLGGVLSVLLSAFVISSGLFIVDEFSTEDGKASSYIRQSKVGAGVLRLSIFYKPFVSEKLNDFFDEQKAKIPKIPSADIPAR